MSFSGAQCACGVCNAYGSWYMQGKSRWPCGTRIKICGGPYSRCVVASVVDFGPSCTIESAAGGPVVTASPNVCQTLFGMSACGYLDKHNVTAVAVPPNTPLGVSLVATTTTAYLATVPPVTIPGATVPTLKTTTRAAFTYPAGGLGGANNLGGLLQMVLGGLFGGSKAPAGGSPSSKSPSGSPSGKSPSGSPSGKSPSGSPSGKSPSGSPSGKSPSGSPSGKSPSGSPPSSKSPSGSPSGKSPSGSPPSSKSPSGKSPSGKSPSGKSKSPASMAPATMASAMTPSMMATMATKAANVVTGGSTSAQTSGTTNCDDGIWVRRRGADGVEQVGCTTATTATGSSTATATSGTTSCDGIVNVRRRAALGCDTSASTPATGASPASGPATGTTSCDGIVNVRRRAALGCDTSGSTPATGASPASGPAACFGNAGSMSMLVRRQAGSNSNSACATALMQYTGSDASLLATDDGTVNSAAYSYQMSYNTPGSQAPYSQQGSLGMYGTPASLPPQPAATPGAAPMSAPMSAPMTAPGSAPNGAPTPSSSAPGSAPNGAPTPSSSAPGSAPNGAPTPSSSAPNGAPTPSSSAPNGAPTPSSSPNGAPTPSSSSPGNAPTPSPGNSPTPSPPTPQPAPQPTPQAPTPQAPTPQAQQSSNSQLYEAQVLQPAPHCVGVSGKCQDISLACPHAYLSGVCAGASANIKCCPRNGPANVNPYIQPGLAFAKELCSGVGLVFPLAVGSLHHISVNYGGALNGGKQCHAGIDLYAQGTKKVVAVGDGTVIGVVASTTVCTCTGKQVASSHVLIYHPAIGRTIQYGELTTANVAVKKGQRVAAGQYLGTAGACCLLHFALYNGTVSAPLTWTPQSGTLAKNPDGCVETSLSTKPEQLLDPRPLLNCLKPATASLLEDQGVGSEELQGVSKGLSGGFIALIVVASVLVLACIGVAIGCVVRRRRAGEEVSIGNSAYHLNMNSFNNASGSSGAPATMMTGGSRAMMGTAAMPSAGGVAMFSAREELPPPSAPQSMPTFGTLASDASGTHGARTMTMAPMPGTTVFDPRTRFQTAAPPAALPFPCPHCEKAYNYAPDLMTHIQLRHAV